METIRPSDRFIPWYIATFFVAFTALLSWFGWFAVQHYNGEITKDSYKKGLAYNRVISSAEAQQALHWKSTLDTRTDGSQISATFTLADMHGPITGAQVFARFVRPTQAGNDADIRFSESAPGQYTASTGLAWRGVWEMRLSATARNHNYQMSKTVILP